MRATFAANQECLANAMSAEREHRLAFFDAMPWAAAREAGRQLLISEDFEGSQGIEGVTFVDPFLERNATLLVRCPAPGMTPFETGRRIG